MSSKILNENENEPDLRIDYHLALNFFVSNPMRSGSKVESSGRALAKNVRTTWDKI